MFMPIVRSMDAIAEIDAFYPPGLDGAGLPSPLPELAVPRRQNHMVEDRRIGPREEAALRPPVLTQMSCLMFSHRGVVPNRTNN
jgi:hypothetical protein